MMDKEKWKGSGWTGLNWRKRSQFPSKEVMRDLKEAEDTLEETDFQGAEERLFRRMMERKAAEEEAAKKKAQLRKKRRAVIVALAAVFMLALGFTAVGEKSYFFRYREKNEGVVFNNDQNKVAVSKLEEAYLMIEETFEVKMPRLGYEPEELKFDALYISGETAIIAFEYREKKIYFIQEYQDTQTSRGTSSDRKDIGKIHNKWLKKDIIMTGNELDSGETEYGAQFSIGNYIYRFCGIMDEKEFEKIIETIYFFE